MALMIMLNLNLTCCRRLQTQTSLLKSTWSKQRSMSQLVFRPHLDDTLGKFAPRLGTVSLRRQDGSEVEDIATPGLITTTSRGIVPHLSRDHVEGTDAIRWAQIHFETL